MVDFNRFSLLDVLDEHHRAHAFLLHAEQGR